jgi:hypothetical protein
MCERAKDEPLMTFWFRQFKEEPLRVMILMTMGAMVYMYQDGQQQQEAYREDMKAQNAALIQQIEKTNEVLSTMEVRIGSCDNRLLHLEREHEAARNGNSH